jgi:hypothetical protein
MSGDFVKAGCDVEAAEESGTEDDSGKNFADHSGLVELYEEKAEQVR